MRKPFIAANWKMHGSFTENQIFLDKFLQLVEKDTLNACVVICPPTVYLQQVSSAIRDQEYIALGAQDCFEGQLQGAYTGEVSAAMLKDAGCEYLIVGHSERRQMFGETHQTIAKKLRLAYDLGLTSILCVGESGVERKSDLTFKVIDEQLSEVFKLLDRDIWPNLMIAYEPVWAIGTGLTASPEQAQAVHAHIRRFVAERSLVASESLRVIYGGSVKPDNAKALFEMKDIDGALVGGASLDPDAFARICFSVKKS